MRTKDDSDRIVALAGDLYRVVAGRDAGDANHALLFAMAMVAVQLEPSDREGIVGAVGDQLASNIKTLLAKESRDFLRGAEIEAVRAN